MALFRIVWEYTALVMMMFTSPYRLGEYHHDACSIFSYNPQCHPILYKYWNIFGLPVLPENVNMLVVFRSSQYWNTKMVQYCPILVYQYLGLKIYFFRSETGSCWLLEHWPANLYLKINLIIIKFWKLDCLIHLNWYHLQRGDFLLVKVYFLFKSGQPL